jgi:hypothetical protein
MVSVLVSGRIVHVVNAVLGVPVDWLRFQRAFRVVSFRIAAAGHVGPDRKVERYVYVLTLILMTALNAALNEMILLRYGYLNLRSLLHALFTSVPTAGIVVFVTFCLRAEYKERRERRQRA